MPGRVQRPPCKRAPPPSKVASRVRAIRQTRIGCRRRARCDRGPARPAAPRGRYRAGRADGARRARGPCRAARPRPAPSSPTPLPPRHDPSQAQEPVGLVGAQPARLLPPGQRAAGRCRMRTRTSWAISKRVAMASRVGERQSRSGLVDDRLVRRLALPQHAFPPSACTSRAVETIQCLLSNMASMVLPHGTPVNRGKDSWARWGGV